MCGSRPQACQFAAAIYELLAAVSGFRSKLREHRCLDDRSWQTCQTQFCCLSLISQTLSGSRVATLETDFLALAEEAKIGAVLHITHCGPSDDLWPTGGDVAFILNIWPTLDSPKSGNVLVFGQFSRDNARDQCQERGLCVVVVVAVVCKTEKSEQ